MSCAALDQRSLAASGDKSLALIFLFCAHHQACLAKKPVILAAEGVASGHVPASVDSWVVAGVVDLCEL